jgi:DNA polymerase I-like protein with 3'-5' exonuclease and polymerase domains
MQLDKDEWRRRSGEFRNVPLSAWPEGAIQYPIRDAEATMGAFKAQELRNKERGGGKFLVDEGNQVRKAWWIHLMASWGIRTNPKRVDSLIEKTNGAYSELEAVLQEEKLIRSDGTRDMKAVRSRMEKAMGGRDKCRLTKKGQISTDNDACMSSDDPMLQAYAELAQFKAVVSKDAPMLQLGRWLPIHSRFDTLLETGRTSSSKPNIQNIRRMAGIRECFVPRPGKVFACADYDGLELRTLAQVCYSLFGQSDLRDALNEGRDPHLEVAAYLLRISYEEAKARRKKKDKDVDRARQMGKVCNFGCPGGLGAQTLVAYAKANFGLVLTEQETEDLKYNVWRKRWPEMQKYMNFISNNFDSDDSCPPIEQLFSGRYRGGCRYTQACNTLFQGLGADATGAAGFLISQACYVDIQSVLYGSRIVNYIHDEFILEVPEEKGHDCAMELARLMEDGARPWLPDVPPKVSEPLLARCWSKDARQVWGEDGRLLPWTSDYY